MRILIIRHAEPDFPNDRLTAKGRREAELLSERMANIPAAAYYVSPLVRAQETAFYTLQKVGRKAETLPWLAEFRARVIDPETGASHVAWDFRSALWHDHPTVFERDRWFEDPIMQTGPVSQIWEETCQGVDDLLLRHGYRRDNSVYRCEKNDDQTNVLFCHFGIGMAIVSYLIGVSPFPMWEGFQLAPSSVTTLITQERRKGEVEFRCLCAGDISHLMSANEPVSLAGLFPECYNGMDNSDPASWPEIPDNPALK